MVSTKQLEANRQNAKLGGVKTPQGKSMSRFNARKHSILSQSLTDYDKDIDIDAFIDELIDTYGPAEGLRGILIERASICYLKLYRVQMAETEHLKATLDPRVVTLGLRLHSIDVVENEGYTPKITFSSVEQLVNIYGRYETTLENRLFRILQALEQLRVTTINERAE